MQGHMFGELEVRALHPLRSIERSASALGLPAVTAVAAAVAVATAVAAPSACAQRVTEDTVASIVEEYWDTLEVARGASLTLRSDGEAGQARIESLALEGARFAVEASGDASAAVIAGTTTFGASGAADEVVVAHDGAGEGLTLLMLDSVERGPGDLTIRVENRAEKPVDGMYLQSQMWWNAGDDVDAVEHNGGAAPADGRGALKISISRGAAMRIQPSGYAADFENLVGYRTNGRDAVLELAGDFVVRPDTYVYVGDAVEDGTNFVLGQGGVLAYGKGDDAGRILFARGTTVRFEPGSLLVLEGDEVEDLADRLRLRTSASNVSGLGNLGVLVNTSAEGGAYQERGHLEIDAGGNFVFVGSPVTARGPMAPVVTHLFEGVMADSVGIPAFWRTAFAKNDVEALSQNSASWVEVGVQTGTENAVIRSVRAHAFDPDEALRVLAHASACASEREKEAALREQKAGEAAEGEEGAKADGFAKLAHPNLPIVVDVSRTTMRDDTTVRPGDDWTLDRDEDEIGATFYGRLEKPFGLPDLLWGVRAGWSTADVDTDVVTQNRFSGESNVVTVSIFGAVPTAYGYFSADLLWASADDSTTMPTYGTMLVSNDIERTFWSAGFGWTSPAWTTTYGSSRWSGRFGAGLRGYRIEGSGGDLAAGAETILATDYGTRTFGEASLTASLAGEGAFTRFNEANDDGETEAWRRWTAALLPRSWHVWGSLSGYALAGDTDVTLSVRTVNVSAEYAGSSRFEVDGPETASVSAKLGAGLAWRDSTLGVWGAIDRGVDGFDAKTIGIRYGYVL